MRVNKKRNGREDRERARSEEEVVAAAVIT